MTLSARAGANSGVTQRIFLESRPHIARGSIAAMRVNLPTDDEFTNAMTALMESQSAPADEVIRAAVLERFQRTSLMQAVESDRDQRVAHMQTVLERLRAH